jgi:hypothetical protein
MNPFETMVAEYNSTLPTISDGEGRELQLTSRGVLLVTMKDGDGTQVIVKDGDDVSGGIDRGIIGYGVDTSNIAHPFKVDSNGALIVNVDVPTGISMDKGVDELGDGELVGVTGSYQTIVTIALTSGSAYAISAFDGSADQLAEFQLVIDDGAAPVVVRNMLVTENLGTNQLVFPRPREWTVTNSTTNVLLKARSIRANRTATVSGGINMYKV